MDGSHEGCRDDDPGTRTSDRTEDDREEGSPDPGSDRPHGSRTVDTAEMAARIQQIHEGTLRRLADR